MRLRAEQLESHLARNFAPVWLIHGDEPLLALEAADAVRAAARKRGHSEREVHFVERAFDWSQFAQSAASQSLFGERKIVELRLASGRPSAAAAAALESYCAHPGPDIALLVTMPRPEGTGWWKSGWFNAIDRAGTIVEAQPVTRAQLPQWLAARLARQKQHASAETLELMADRVEGNLLAAHQELQKLALLHGEGVLGFEQIETSVLDVARYDIAKLVEAVWAGHTARVLRMLAALEAEGESAVYLHWTLAEDIRALARARAALDAGQPLPMALREARVWGAKEKLLERVLPSLSAPALARWLQAARVCDGLCKGLTHPQWPQGAWPALQHLVLMLLEGVARNGRDRRDEQGGRRWLALSG